MAKNDASNLPATAADLMAGLDNLGTVAKQEKVAGGEGLTFMKFNGVGEYSYGAEGTEVEEKSQWAVNPMSLTHGYQCWAEGELRGNVLAGLNDPPINRNELDEISYFDKKAKEDTVAEWNAFRGFTLVCVSGMDEGLQCSLGKTSRGFRNAWDDLVDAIKRQVEKDPSNCVPIVVLENDSYMHKNKTYGEIFTPIFRVTGWTDMQATEIEADEPEEPEAAAPADDGIEDADIKEEAPKPRRGRKTAEAPAEEKAPRRQRKRS